MNDGKVEVLRNLPFLEGVEPDALERLAAAVAERHFQPGQIILEEGSIGGDVYLVAARRQ